MTNVIIWGISLAIFFLALRYRWAHWTLVVLVAVSCVVTLAIHFGDPLTVRLAVAIFALFALPFWAVRPPPRRVDALGRSNREWRAR